MNVTRLIMAVITASLLAGCIGLSFKEEQHVTNRHVSAGQELMDLHAAHEKGLINEAEYQAARQDILDRSKPPEPDNTAEKEKEGE